MNSLSHCPSPTTGSKVSELPNQRLFRLVRKREPQELSQKKEYVDQIKLEGSLHLGSKVCKE